MKDRWLRDLGILEVVEYFDQPAKSDWSLLTSKEIDFLQSEIAKCASDFEYAARNYFWIVDENRDDVPFRLWESQELVWNEIKTLEARGKPQKLFILKARKLGISTLVDALIVWKAMFRVNRVGLVVSYNREHSEFLFSLMLHIYDRMPWWLRPMTAVRKYKDGLMFANPDEEQRKVDPGMNSRVVVSSALDYGGIGQGYTITDVHLSEICDWEQRKAREIISGDLRYSMFDNAETMGVIETTGKGSGTYTEDLWEANYELMDLATWKPKFLGWFFGKERTKPPEPAWKPAIEEVALRDRIKDEWVQCPACETLQQANWRGESIVGITCRDCSKAAYRPYLLSDQHLRWYWEERINAEKQGPESLKTFTQEVAGTVQDCFQLFGDQVFSAGAFEWVNRQVRDQTMAAIGNLDEAGRLHAVKIAKTGACYQSSCTENHEFDRDKPLRVWELPQQGAKYIVGADPGQGIGRDYSVGWVNRISASGLADVHVATYRSNTVAPYFFADVLNVLGRWYNNAVMAIEYNGNEGVADRVKHFHAYPNIWRWKNPEAQKMLSSRDHWYTNAKSKELLWQTADYWLRTKSWTVRDPIFAYEMKYFVRFEPGSRTVGASDERRHDDVIMAALVALYCSHDTDAHSRDIPMPNVVESGLSPWKPWQMVCTKCEREWGADYPQQVEMCPNCRSIMIKGRKNEAPEPGFDPSVFNRSSYIPPAIEADVPFKDWYSSV